MSSISISFTSQIYNHARAHGIDLTRHEVESLSASMNSVARVDENNQVAFDLGLGPVATLDQAISMLSVGMGRPAQTKAPSTAIPANASATERAVLTNQATKAGSNAAKREQAQKLATVFGNPWTADRPNRTNAAFISNHAPELAVRLKREAGVR